MMNPKIGIAIGIVSMILYGMIMMMRSDPEERYRAIEEGRPRGRTSQTQSSEPEFESYMAYQLQVKAQNPDVSYSTYASSDIRDALWNELKPHITSPYGLNPSSGQYAGKGDLGTFLATLIVKEREYKGSGSESFKQWSIPYFIEMTLEVTSNRGSSTWDGEHTFLIELEPPSSISEDSLSYERTRHIKAMAKELVQKLTAEIGPFKRD